MPYCIEISNNLVTFKSEKDYLNCRLEYLRHSEEVGDSPYHSFFGFISEDIYDKSICEIESIKPKQEQESPPNDEWPYISTNGNITYANNNSFTPTDTLSVINYDTDYYSGAISDVEINSTSQLPTDIGSYNNTSDSWYAKFDLDWLDLSIKMIKNQIEEEEAIKNDNSIEDRSEILDL